MLNKKLKLLQELYLTLLNFGHLLSANDDVILLKADFHFPMFFSLENRDISSITSLKLLALRGYKRLCIIIISFFLFL